MSHPGSLTHRFHWPFIKAHGLGNDFLLQRGVGDLQPIAPALVRHLCDRRRGVGADGVILVTPPTEQDSVPGRMVLYNADGGEAQISGNGLRCAVAALRCWWPALLDSHPVELVTGAGTRAGRIVKALAQPDAAQCHPVPLELEVEVEMGQAQLTGSALPLSPAARPDSAGRLTCRVPDGRQVQGVAVSTGNPHLVVSGPLPAPEEIEQLGPLLEHHPFFPERINIIWMDQPHPGLLRLKIWERGCGVTPACGSGACAAATIAVRSGWLPAGARVRVLMDGGEAMVQLPRAEQEPLRLSGPAVLSAQGEALLPFDLF